jgi:hypothetical protein
VAFSLGNCSGITEENHRFSGREFSYQNEILLSNFVNVFSSFMYVLRVKHKTPLVLEVDVMFVGLVVGSSV